jgi:uncharacterized membrane protein required for colicin V production
MWLDGCAVLVIAIAAWKGAAKGAVWQLAVLGSIAACILLAGEATPHIEHEIPLEQPLRHWVAVAAVYAGISLVVFLLARTLRGWLEKVKFVEYDRHWGAILGAFKGIILVLAVTCLLLIMAPSTHAMIRESVTGALTNRAIQYAAPMLPEKLARALQKAMNSSEETEQETELSLPLDGEIRGVLRRVL